MLNKKNVIIIIAIIFPSLYIGIIKTLNKRKRLIVNYDLINIQQYLSGNHCKDIIIPASIPVANTFVHYLVPLCLQHFIRDSGLFAVLSDNAAVALGAILLLVFKPKLVIKQ